MFFLIEGYRSKADIPHGRSVRVAAAAAIQLEGIISRMLAQNDVAVVTVESISEDVFKAFYQRRDFRSGGTKV